MSLLLSFTNLIASASGITPSTEATGYEAANLATPERPFVPWRTTVTTDSNVVIDFGTATAVALLGLIHANVTAITVQGNATDSWGAPSYSQAVTLARDPYTWRYRYVYQPTSFTYRYLRLLIGSQTPVDSAAYFSLGGLWAGAATSSPNHWQWGGRVTTLRPKTDVGPAHQGWSQRLKMGSPRVRFEMPRHASLSLSAPGTSDGLDSWLDIERQAWDADAYLGFVNLGDPTQGYVVRSVSDPSFTLTGGIAEETWTAEEVVGP